jgi:hypothetical protein
MVARLSALLVVAVVAVVALAASPAASASYATKVVISLKTPAFNGKLKSSKSSCASGRTVKLFRKKRGADEFLGSDRSNAKGKWSIPIGKRLRSGSSYYAKAPAKGNCRAGKSKALAIG